LGGFIEKPSHLKFLFFTGCWPGMSGLSPFVILFSSLMNGRALDAI
jgi:hypothetical protein